MENAASSRLEHHLLLDALQWRLPDEQHVRGQETCSPIERHRLLARAEDDAYAAFLATGRKQ
jgi:hypothetical protein